ncbi:hypothetical protein AB4Z40_29365 [Bosea sp. 2YAB26]|uniref:hypothetical protein n=1 Tax=Bosea sp. 2YAB26 TaxID=3237478 RepID=UPI003F939605
MTRSEESIKDRAKRDGSVISAPASAIGAEERRRKRERTKASIANFGAHKQTSISLQQLPILLSKIRPFCRSPCSSLSKAVAVDIRRLRMTAAFSRLYGANAISGEGCAEYR